MEAIMKWNGIINGIVWGPWMLTLLVGTGIWFTFILGFPQLRYFGAMLKEVFGRLFKKSQGDGNISSFAAVATALAATVGTGNVAGVATALHLGGPGALFWMLFSAFFGMTTKFCEVTLAVKYREKDESGTWRGGTMYVLEKGCGMKWLAVIFALFTLLASFGIGNMVQANSTAEAVSMAFDIPHIYTAIVMGVLVGLVVMGGLTRIATITVYLVPVMALIYIVGAIAVVAKNSAMIPTAFKAAFVGAFSDPMALPGALAGWAVKEAIKRGIARGVFSNEAGLGSAPMVHAAAQVDHPVQQGLYGIFEVFMDTIVICTLTSLVIMTTGVLTSEAGAQLTGAQLTLAGFDAALGHSAGSLILSAGLALFAMSTILGWYYYGETALTYIFPISAIPVFKVVWVACVVLGGWGGAKWLTSLWDLADTLNGLMAIPNLIGLLLMTKVIKELVKDFDTKRKNGEL
ncbi:MAG: sodium:alanine symporter family protein [Pyramidobacter sp.]|nr:sodium:alanine symporter family protein [Pyramidobacter sp.]